MVFNLPQVPSGGGAAYQIERSLRFNSADSAYLNRTFSGSPTSDKKRDFSYWVKQPLVTPPVPYVLVGLRGNSDAVNPAGDSITINTSYDLLPRLRLSCGGDAGILWTTQVFRDPTAPFHIYVKLDTTEATADNRMRVWKNGVEITSFVSRTNPALNTSIRYGSASYTQYIGRSYNSYGDMYLSAVDEVDGGGTAVTDFGEFDATTGAWNPIAPPNIDYGSTGFRNLFADNSDTTSATLGKDTAPITGNHSAANNWTPNNFSVTAGAGNDSLTDTPTNYGTGTDTGGVMRGNYCVLNPLDKGSDYTITDAGMTYTTGGSGAHSGLCGTFPLLSGKWYFEATLTTAVRQTMGVMANGAARDVTPSSNANMWAFDCQSADKVGGGAASSPWGVAQSVGNTVCWAVDVTNGKIWAGSVSGGTITWFESGNPATATNPMFTGLAASLKVFINNNASGTACGAQMNFGQRPYAATNGLPSGFLSLCTQNITDSAVEKPSTGFTPTLYTGTGATLSITGLNFGPDFVWIKSRSAATDHALYDTSRGTQARLESNTLDAEITGDDGLTAFGSAGFTLGTLAQVNTSSATYVAWCWEESVTYGFDIVLYAGNATNRTVAHGAGSVPYLIITYNRSAASESHRVYHNAMGATKYMNLQATDGADTQSFVWNNTEPTSSVFSLGTNSAANGNGNNIIAYVWAPVSGFSFFGSYTGNGSTDGPFVATGFRPAYFFTKRYSDTGAYMTWDSARLGYNVDNNDLRLNSTDSEQSDNVLDLVASGVKLRNNDSTWYNASGSSYVIAAFAEQNFKNARAF